MFNIVWGTAFDRIRCVAALRGRCWSTVAVDRTEHVTIAKQCAHLANATI